MKRILTVIAAFGLPVCAGAAHAQDPSGYTAPFADTMESRIFPLPVMLRAADGWAKAMAADPALAQLAATRAARVPGTDCAPAPQCLADAWLWTEADIAIVDARLRALARDTRLAKSLIADHIRKSGRFARHWQLADADLLAAAWRDTARGLNNVIAIYAKGTAPRYPKIDGFIFDIANPEYTNVLKAQGTASAALRQADDTVFEPSLRYAAGLLRMNERTEAAPFRPLLGGDNAAAAEAVKTAVWKDHPYPALLVFGHGPEDAQSRTGVMGHIRMGIAAAMFKQGAAPFIVVSGGNVHPNRTPFNEAVEMKRLLIEQHGIPADRILMEPHARHTTTNLRNCARLLLAAGFPADRPSLIVSDHLTIKYITSPLLAERGLEEMGIRPGKAAAGPDQFTALFTPDPAAFHVEPLDPLDP
jgi:hypothetical protein